MLIQKIIGNIKDFPIGTRRIEKVYLEWFELEKKLMRKTLESGEEVGIRLLDDDSHNNLQDGDVLYVDEERIVVVELLPSELTEIEIHSIKEMGYLCFEIGNRHLSLSIEDDKVTIPYDEPTFEYLVKLGFCPVKVEKKFSHFTVCHAHEHTHNSAHDIRGHHHA